MRIGKKIALLFICVLAFAPRQGYAWGAEGHAAIVRLAFQLMPAVQRERLDAMLGTQDPWFIGNWADREGREQFPESKPWHFVDIPPDATAYSASRDCYRGCLLSELPRIESELHSHSISNARRRTDLLFFIHFLGDLYQPFHNIGPLGANDITVIFDDTEENLHAVWDYGIIRNHGIDNAAMLTLARKLQSAPLETNYAKIAMQGHDIAMNNLVKSGTNLPANYSQTHWPIVERALVMAALQIVARTKDL